MKRPRSVATYSHSEPIYETDVAGKRRRTGSRHVTGSGRQLGEPTYYKKAILAVLLAAASSTFGGCTAYDRNAAQPTGGKLPADLAVDGQFGGPTFTGEVKPAVGATGRY